MSYFECFTCPIFYTRFHGEPFTMDQSSTREGKILVNKAFEMNLSA